MLGHRQKLLNKSVSEWVNETSFKNICVLKYSRKVLHTHYLPLCCGLASADSRFISVTMTFCVRAGEQRWSALKDGAAGVMREGHGDGHGEG